MRAKYRSIAMIASLVASGTVFQTAACAPRALVNFGRNFNPCGTVLNCDPVLFRFISSGYQGPGVDPDVDPACTFPPFCANDPFVGGGANP